MKRTILALLMTLPVLLLSACGAETTPDDSGPAQPEAPAASESTPGGEEAGGGAVDPRMAEIERMLRDGNKIQAIKRYREIHGVGLKDAKDAVDAIANGLSSSK